MSENTIDEIYQQFRRVGAAIAHVNANNTHSGNLSMRDPQDEDVFYITSTGSQSAAIIPQDVVPVSFSGVSWGDARGSTESTIHRRLLSIPGANAVIHAHYLNATFVSFDKRDRQLLLEFLGTDEKGREEFLFHPVDLNGCFAVGGVHVGTYHQPVGSEEMEERIPKYLSAEKATIVRGHGPFVRAGSLEEALHLLSVLESSTKLVMFLRRRGVDTVEIQKAIQKRGVKHFFPSVPHSYQDIDFSPCEVNDVTVIEDFLLRLNYNYNNQLGAFATGSMSQKVTSEEMIYCPASAIPEDFPVPLLRIGLSFEEDDPLDLRMHKLIYQHTHQNACMITTSPLAVAEGMAVLAEQYGKEALIDASVEIPYTMHKHPVVMPIDAEAIYLNPQLGLVDLFQLTDLTSENPILNMLRWHKGCCIVAGYGVISTGEATLEQAAHNAASAERIAQFREAVFINNRILNGPPVGDFEPRM